LQPNSLILDPSNPQAWNRYSYVLNNPVRYNNPSGHKACGDGEKWECGTGKKQDPCKPSPKKSLPKVDDNSKESSGIVVNSQVDDILSLDTAVDPTNLIYDPASVFDPFATNKRVVYCQVNDCRIQIYSILGKYCVDWSRIDLKNLG
jgi:hypothetical protein